MADDFDAAASWLSSNPAAASLPNDVKLEIYGLFKFANTGAGPSTSRPSIFSMQARAKHDAWVTQAQKYVDDTEGAKARYIEIAKDLGWEGGRSGSGGAMGGVRVSMMAQEDQEEGSRVGETSKLHEAVLDGNVKEVERILAAGGVVDTRDEYGLTPLHLAADRGNQDMVKLLLQKGANTNLTDEDEQTPLMLAQSADRKDIADLLRSA